jgi:DNA-binding transcriptional MerR regulator
MSYEQDKTEKLFYTISEVADLFDVNASLIRFWEKEFPAIKPTTNKKGNRLYTKKEIELISKIYDLVKEKGFTLQGAKEQMKSTRLKKQTNDTKKEVIDNLLDIKQKLLDLREKLK